MEITKKWTRYQPTDGRALYIDDGGEGKRISYLKSECGKDWHEYSEGLPKGTYALAYDDDGVIHYWGSDPTLVHPHELHVLVTDRIPEGFSGYTNHKFAVIDGEIVESEIYKNAVKEKKVKVLVERIHKAQVDAMLGLPAEDVAKLLAEYKELHA